MHLLCRPIDEPKDTLSPLDVRDDVASIGSQGDENFHFQIFYLISLVLV